MSNSNGPGGRGCVSGAQIEHLRNAVDRDGTYMWDFLDGYDDMK